MRKFISLFLVIAMIMSICLMTACGSKDENTDLSTSEYVGSWKAVAMSLQDNTENIEENWILTVNEDGTGTLSDGKETSDFTWSPTKDGFKTKGDVKLTFTKDGDKIKAKILGVDLLFAKE